MPAMLNEQLPSVEFSRQADPFLDFCLWEYESEVAGQDKLRSINLLNNSFAAARGTPELYNLCNKLRTGLGDWRTVWGTKYINGKLSWEFYFYDYLRLERDITISKTLDIFRGFTKCDLQVNEDCLYFMFSIDIDDDLVRGKRNLDQINIYLGDISKHVSAGICYNLDRHGLRMDNLYHFFDARNEMDQITDKVVSSLHVQLEQFDINTVLIPELSDCSTIVIANKKFNDGVYFCRINIDQLIHFLQRLDYPAGIQDFVRENRDKLDHLLYDVGIDYRMENGKTSYLKSSYYGVF